ncbi:hypothetical protein J6590_069474 [Homalodisca vitripennis]|nr:hypothetical protein J6590_069474 [Homalodisca vitripennis]
MRDWLNIVSPMMFLVLVAAGESDRQPDVDYLTEQGTGWRCDPCNKTRRKSMRLEYAAEGLAIETIMNTLKEMREEQKTNSVDFNRSYEMLYSKSRIEDLGNYSRRNCVESQGISDEREEHVSKLFNKVGKALDVNITDSMIDACHRIGKKTSERNQTRGIIVKFMRRTDKEDLMKKRREKKMDLSTRNLGLAQARQLRKERGYK